MKCPAFQLLCSLLVEDVKYYSTPEFTVIQIGRPLVRFQIVSLEFFIDIILPIALGWTQPLTEMSTRSISSG